MEGFPSQEERKELLMRHMLQAKGEHPESHLRYTHGRPFEQEISRNTVDPKIKETSNRIGANVLEEKEEQ